MKRGGTLQIAPVLACLMACLLGVKTFRGAQTSLGDYDVTVTLYRPSDGAERTMQQPLSTLTTITVPPAVNSVRELLRRVHLYANSESASLIYTLNSGLLDPLHPGQEVRIVQI